VKSILNLTDVWSGRPSGWRREIGGLASQRASGMNFKNNTSLAKKLKRLLIIFLRHILPFKSFIKEEKNTFRQGFFLYRPGSQKF
jgi:hypothetical protein